MKSAWLRMKNFVKRAGTIVVAAVFLLSMLNSVGIENGEISFGNEDSQSSLLAYAGKAINPVFAPMGITAENWPASVALFTGLFAKEAIVGTINSLYATMDEQEPLPEANAEDSGLAPYASIVEAFTSVGEGFAGIISSMDILGLGLITEDAEAIGEEIGANNSVYKHIAANFTLFSAFAYLLFVLMYFPCLAVIGAARQEMGGYYAGVMAVYSTVLAWAVATLFYQLAEGHNFLYIIISIAILFSLYGWLHLLGKKEKEFSIPVFAPPIRRDYS